MSKIIATLYAVMDKRPLRALSFVMALLLAGCMFWDPSRFAAKTSELEIWHGLLLMWAVCAGVIHGVGFRPQKVLWQGIFCPLLADIVLIVGLKQTGTELRQLYGRVYRDSAPPGVYR